MDVTTGGIVVAEAEGEAGVQLAMGNLFPEDVVTRGAVVVKIAISKRAAGGVNLRVGYALPVRVRHRAGHRRAVRGMAVAGLVQVLIITGRLGGRARAELFRERAPMPAPGLKQRPARAILTAQYLTLPITRFARSTKPVWESRPPSRPPAVPFPTTSPPTPAVFTPSRPEVRTHIV